MLISLTIKWGLYFNFLDINKIIDVQLGVLLSWIATFGFGCITTKNIFAKKKSKKNTKEKILFFSTRIAMLILEMILTYLFFNKYQLTSNTWIISITFTIQVIIMLINCLINKKNIFKKAA